MNLPDGMVAPSFLQFQPEEVSARAQAATEFALRVGTVIKGYAPADSDSLTRSAWEYDVECLVTDSMGQPTILTYPHCIMASAFGSISDYFKWSPRISTKRQRDTSAAPDLDALQEGSQVHLLAPNGNSATTAIIIGAGQHPLSPTDDAAFGDGALLRFEYNGLFVEISKDGELEIRRKGPTKVDGTAVELESSDLASASIRMDKGGRIQVQTGDGLQYLTLDGYNRTAACAADKGMTFDVADGKIETTASQGVKLGGDEPLVLGKTYTDAEADFLQGLTEFTTNLMAIFISLGGALAAGPASTAAVPLQSPSVTLAFQQFTGAIQTFSGHLSADVLSRKNTTE